MGHVRDLPKSKLGVDVEDGFEPSYEVIASRKKVLKELKDAAKDADDVYLAPDPDREGEAIAWHLAEELGSGEPEEDPPGDVQRDHQEGRARGARATRPTIDKQMVDAQQARRILDRLVGYKLSPLLWDKVRRGLSAGRVQSVAVRLIVEREREIDAFVPEEYWTIDGAARRRRQPPGSTPSCSSGTAANVEIGNEDEARRGRSPICETATWTVDSVEHEGARRSAPSALHHLQLQQERRALPGQADDEARAAPLRRHRAAATRAGRPHHLHAHRLDARRRRGARRGARVHRRQRYGASTCPRSRTSTRRRRTRRTRTRRSARPRCSTSRTTVRAHLTPDQFSSTR